MILDRKKNITSEELCKNLPKYIELYVGYVKNLQYEEDSDYDYLKGLFEECIRGMKETYDNIYDWSTISNFRTVLRERKFHIEGESDEVALVREQ